MLKIKTSEKLSSIRKSIAEKMNYSLKNIPQFTILKKINVTKLVSYKNKINKKSNSKENVKISYSDLLLKVCSLALKKNIILNSTLKEDKLIIYEDINIGLVVLMEDGVIIPTFYNCDEKNIHEIALNRRYFVKNAKNKKLTFDQISNGTFTLTNVGILGVRSATALIFPPQSSILSCGEIYKDTIVEENNEIKYAYFIDVTISCDHRIIDGHTAAKFLNDFSLIVENIEKI